MFTGRQLIRRKPVPGWPLFSLPVGLLLLAPPAGLANSPPNTPTITEPSFDGKIVNPQDVHMETGPFSDPDSGHIHLCSDWEIWTITPNSRVWATLCITGIEKVHTHLGDGTFEGSHAGRTTLLPDTDYKLRTRHRDSSGDVATEWSAYAERMLHTGPATVVFPMSIDDVASSPDPQWTDSASASIILPPASTPPGLTLGSADGQSLLEVRANDGVSNLVLNPGPLSAHVSARIHLQTGGLSSSLLLPESRLSLTDDDGKAQTIYLPSINLAPGQHAYYWISANGSTFVGTASQTSPDFSTLARGAPVPWTVSQPGYQVEVVATGFQLPVNIAFAPNPGPNPTDPYYYVTELYGRIKVVRRNGAISDYATGLLNFNPTGAFPGSGEQGVAGIVVDPASGDIFAGMLYEAAGSPPPHYPKVVRFHSNDGGITAATQTTILSMAGETQGQSHQISNFSIGPDGKLYVHMGDGFDATKGQDLTSFRGKVLRMNFDGTAVSTNPFYNAADGITARDYVFAYGLRNPFGGAWRTADGFHYEAENGPSVDRFAKIVSGRNYLYDGSDASMANYALYNWNPATGPVNLVFIQSSLFGGSGFPAAKMDHAFVTESGSTWATGTASNGKRITEFVLDASGNRLSGPTPLVQYNGSGKATAVALAAGPDGLYFSDFYKDDDLLSAITRGSNILRIRYVGSASFTANTTSGATPLTVQFTDVSSVTSPSAWLWDFGDTQTSTLQNPAHVYTTPGIYTVTLRVTGASTVSVAQQLNYIRAGTFPKVAFISGTIPPSATDAAIANRLRQFGFTVDQYDDDRANRPTAAQIAAAHNLVIVSSTIASANVAGDFASVAIPLVYWESAMNSTARETLATSGATYGAMTTVFVTNNTHPVTTGLPLGNVQVFNPSAIMSVAVGPFATGAGVLATRAGSSEVAILVAEAGASLLAGHIAPARRVFLFLEDASYSSTTAMGKQIVDQAVLWALNLPTAFVRPDFDKDRDVDAKDFTHLLACLTGADLTWVSSGCLDADFDADGDVDESDFGILQRCLSGPGIIASCPY